MTNSLTASITGIQVKALEATKACPCVIKSKHLKVGWSLPWRSCPDCKGTGCVYVLDHDGELGLRVRCPNAEKDPIWHNRIAIEVEGLNCAGCGVVPSEGIYYTPSPDIAAWIECVRAMKWELIIIGSNDKGFCVVNIKPYGGYLEYVANENTFRDALCSAIGQAVEAIQDG